MPTRFLQSLFAPTSAALIGASERPDSLGTALTRNILAGSFKGALFLLNRHHRRVQDMPTYARLADLPHPPELAIIATPSPTLPKLLTELGQMGTRVAVIASRSSAPGADAIHHFHRILREAAHPSGLRLLGPDSFGIIVPRRGLNASLSHIQPQPGQLALIAQSGAILAPMLEWATTQGIGFAHIIALGERADIDFSDLLDWLTRDPDTRAILLYMETLQRARPFLSAARAAARVKPVLVVRAGRGGDPASHQADAIYDTAFRQAGMLRVQSLRELFWAAETLALDLPVSGNRLAILGNSRGLGLLAADTLLAKSGSLAQFSPATQESLRRFLPPGAAPTNPLDLGSDAGPVRFAASLESVLEERDLDGVLMLHAPNALVSADATAAAVTETIARYRARGGRRLSLLASWLGIDSARTARQLLLEHGIPSYDTPDDAVRAFIQRWHHQQNRSALMETPPDIPELFAVDVTAARCILQQVLAEKRELLATTETSALLRIYGIPVLPSDLTMERQPFPPLHLAIRTLVDPVFGPVLLLGPSGAATALLDDFAAALPPLTSVLARQMIAHARIFPLLRNADAAMTGVLDGVILLLVKVAQLIVDLGEVIELALEPVLVTMHGVTVGAARIRIAPCVEPIHTRLAIRPYPRELEETQILPDGSRLLIRPVRPEDEPAFIAGFARLSVEEIRMRFMHVLKELTHAEAARLTQIDYDREMALVALRQRPGQAPEGCGVARIISDPDRERAEFAILLHRDATGIGLSSLLLHRIIHYAREQGFRELYGEILRENEPMLGLCRAMGFALATCPEDTGVILASLTLE